MKINLDDPNLTAYALDELAGAERAAMMQAVEESVEAQAFVRETQQLAGLLTREFQTELNQAMEKPLNIMPLPAPRSFWSDARWMSIGLAALLAIFAVVAAVTFSERRHNPQADAEAKALRPAQFAASPGDVVMEMESEAPTPPFQPPLVAQDDSAEFAEESTPAVPMQAPPAVSKAPTSSGSAAKIVANARPERKVISEPPPLPAFNTAEYGHYDENPFLPAASNPLSTFSIDVDTASYANVRGFLNSRTKPPKDAVRIEEMINYFTYDYPQPEGGQPFTISLDATGCPWQPEHRLVRIGLKGREVATEKRDASNLVFLLDVSGSMEPVNRLPLVKQSMRLLVDKLTANDRVAIVVYAGASGVALKSTPGDRKAEILRALEELKPGGSTNGAEGIQMAYEIAAAHFIKGGVNRVILATDGDFNVGVTSQGDLARLAQEKARSGVFLTVLGVGDDNLKDSTMQKLADEGNGNYAYLDSIEEAHKVLVKQMNGTLVTIAKDVKVRVEFNPAQVASYRLLGYEKRMLRKEDFNNDKIDAGEIGAGHTVTALYEVVPIGTPADSAASVPPVDALKYQTPNPAAAGIKTDPKSSAELMTVKLRYKQPDGNESDLVQRSLADSGAPFSNAPPDFKFAAAVAEFGMILRDSPYKGNGTLGAVSEWATEGKGRDEAGYRAGFLQMVQQARALAL